MSLRRAGQDDRVMARWRIEELDAGAAKDPHFDPPELGALVLAFLAGIAILSELVGSRLAEAPASVATPPVAEHGTPAPAAPSDAPIARSVRVAYVGADDDRVRQWFTLEGGRLLTGPHCLPARLGAPLPSPILLVPLERAGPAGGGASPDWVLVSCYEVPSEAGP